MSGPLFPDVGVLALPYHNWGPVWLTPHYVLPRLGRYFHVMWLDAPRHWRQFRLARQVASESERSTPGFHVSRSRLPEFYRPGSLRRYLFARRVISAWKQLDRLGCTKRVLHLWHPRFEPALDVGRYDISAYHIDDEYSFSQTTERTTPQESRVLKRVNQVFAISPALMERKGGINPNLEFVPEGVDATLYTAPAAEPDDIAPIPHPRIGYTGALKRQLDWPLLKSLVMARPDWSFVFVGPRLVVPGLEGLVEEISRLPNVHMLGRKTANELAAYVQHFDVSIMPYVVNNYTNNIYPLKLHEYLASGRPVVGSPIRSLLDFNGVIELASSVDEWITALTAGLSPAATSAEAIAVRRAVAWQYDWGQLIHRIATVMADRLSPELAARVRAAGSDRGVSGASSHQ